MHSCKRGTKGKPWDSINSVSKSKRTVKGNAGATAIGRSWEQPSNQATYQPTSSGKKQEDGCMHLGERSQEKER